MTVSQRIFKATEISVRTALDLHKHHNYSSPSTLAPEPAKLFSLCLKHEQWFYYLFKASNLPLICQPSAFATSTPVACSRGFRMNGNIWGVDRQFIGGAGHGDFVADNEDRERMNLPTRDLGAVILQRVAVSGS